eukprot:scaffold4418_cov199-Prasinococcus_capsulatus_cf.AAC.4
MPLLLSAHVRQAVECVRIGHRLPPHALRRDLQRLRVQPRRLLVPLLPSADDRQAVECARVVRAPPPVARLDHPQRCLQELARAVVLAGDVLADHAQHQEHVPAGPQRAPPGTWPGKGECRVLWGLATAERTRTKRKKKSQPRTSCCAQCRRPKCACGVCAATVLASYGYADVPLDLGVCKVGCEPGRQAPQAPLWRPRLTAALRQVVACARRAAAGGPCTQSLNTRARDEARGPPPHAALAAFVRRPIGVLRGAGRSRRAARDLHPDVG